MMGRRAFVAGAASVLAAPLARAQAARVFRVGVLGAASVDETFRQALRSLGYVEGQNLVIEARFHQGQIDRLPALAAELVALRVDVIVCGSTAMARAARAATRTIPIVMAGAANPVAEGLIGSLSRPGGNVTGAILETADVTAKRLELLKETLPRLRRAAAFYPEAFRTNSVIAQWLRDSDAASRGLGIALEPADLPMNLPGSWEKAFDGVARRGIGAGVIAETPVYWNERARLAELALKYRLAVMFPFGVQARPAA